MPCYIHLVIYFTISLFLKVYMYISNFEVHFLSPTIFDMFNTIMILTCSWLVYALALV